MGLYAVNGKEPVAAWIPSRDTAGNGTTTLTDLVGSNNGTLANMDEATDWVADTGAGGVRALDFDGVNDFVNLGLLNPESSGVAISVWIFSRNLPGIARWVTLSNESFVLRSEGSRCRLYYFNSVGTLVSLFTNFGVVNTNQWTHWVGTHNQSRLKIYKNGVEVADMSATSSRRTTMSFAAHMSHPIQANEMFNGRLDDARIFNEALTANDVGYLYADGNGRGILATSDAIQTRRRRRSHSGGGVL